MAFLLGALIGLICALLWALSDTIAKHSVTKIDKRIVLLIAKLTAGVVAIIIGLLLGQFKLFLSVSLAYVFLVAAFGYLGTQTLYSTLKRKGMALSLPIVYLWSLVTVILSIMFYEETLSLVQLIGIVVIVLGIILITLKETKFSFDLGFVFAFLSAIFFGLELFLIKIPSTVFGAVTTAALVKLTVSLLVVPSVPFSKIKKVKPTLFVLICCMGLFEALGMIVFSYGVLIAPVSIVAAASSLNPAFGVLAGLVLYKEKLTKKQAFGVLASLIGIILIAL